MMVDDPVFGSNESLAIMIDDYVWSTLLAVCLHA